MGIKVPSQYKELVEDLRELARDEQNPNRMTKRQKARRPVVE